jgi:hypothetical protein
MMAFKLQHVREWISGGAKAEAAIMQPLAAAKRVSFIIFSFSLSFGLG